MGRWLPADPKRDRASLSNWDEHPPDDTGDAVWLWFHCACGYLEGHIDPRDPGPGGVLRPDDGATWECVICGRVYQLRVEVVPIRGPLRK